MKALAINQYGDANKMKISELSLPALRADDVLVEVKMASINPVDWKIRRGDISLILPRKFPRVLGMDFSGVVVQVGSSVKKFQVGDKVFGMANPFRNQYGTYAEKTLVQESNIALMPEHLSFEDAATLPVAGLTAYEALYKLGAIRIGHNVLINGASGGVGSFAVQLAKLANAKVTAICGPNNVDFVKSLGADEVYNYEIFDINELKQKFAIIFDVSAKLDFWRTKDLLIHDGIFIGTNFHFNLMLASALTLPFGGKRAALIFAGAGGKIEQELSELATLVCDGKLRTVISKIVSVHEVPVAHAEAESEHTRGKVLVKIDDTKV